MSGMGTRWFRTVGLLACLALAAAQWGCALILLGGAAAAGAGVTAVYYKGQMEQEMPASITRAAAAARQALKDLSLPLVEETTERAAYTTIKLKSEYPDGAAVWVTLKELEPGRTMAIVRVGVLGEKGRAQEILAKIYARAGVVP